MELVEVEGYDVEVIGQPSSDMMCVICLRLMRDAVQMPCGHGMCQACFQKLAKYAKARFVPLLCTLCRAVVKEEQVINVPMIDRIILSLQAKCSNTKQGCDWIGDLGDLNMHLITNCEFDEEHEEIQGGKAATNLTIPSILPKAQSNGADICATDGKFYIMRPDIGLYLRTTNLNHGYDLITFKLHKNCIGEHYLATGGKFYIIKGDKYRRVTNMNTDKNSTTYTLHENCKGGDVYFSTGDLFGILFFDTSLCHLTTNMNNDDKGRNFKIPDVLKDGLYHWGSNSKHYCLRQSGWQVEYARYSSFGGSKEDSYDVHSTVTIFLPGGISVLKGSIQGKWKLFYMETNPVGSKISFSKVVKRMHGCNIENTKLMSYEPEVKVMLTRIEFLKGLHANAAFVKYLEEENWEEFKEVEESIRLNLDTKETVYIWQYVLEFQHCQDIFFTKYLSFTDAEEAPPDMFLNECENVECLN